LEKEQSPSAPLQRSAYHSTLIPGTSDVQELQDGSYKISARGGRIGAEDVTDKDAQKFCVAKMQRALVVDNVFAADCRLAF
jgi:hypothetical protein